VPPSTAVTTIKKQEALNIFPNPATTQLILTASYKVRNVIISNLLGQTVLRDEYDTQKVSVDISGLPADIYFIKINGNVVKKFVKEWCAKSF
jgi:hypothetical protein